MKTFLAEMTFYLIAILYALGAACAVIAIYIVTLAAALLNRE